jgi:hypothetical protein
MELVKIPYDRLQQTSADELFKHTVTDTYRTAANDGIADVQLDTVLDRRGTAIIQPINCLLNTVTYFINLAVCLTTGPKPLPKRTLHIVRSRASSFK